MLSACAQLMKGAEQPVIQFRDTKTFKTTCGGAAEDWGSCHRKARRTCSDNYEIVETEQNATGTVRVLIFRCK